MGPSRVDAAAYERRDVAVQFRAGAQLTQTDQIGAQDPQQVQQLGQMTGGLLLSRIDQIAVFPLCIHGAVIPEGGRRGTPDQGTPRATANG
jgi:hypothetical protein